MRVCGVEGRGKSISGQFFFVWIEHEVTRGHDAA